MLRDRNDTEVAYVSVHHNITGIVFWGLVLIGSFCCYGLMYWFEPLLADSYSKRFLDAEIKVHALVPGIGESLEPKFLQQLERIGQQSQLFNIEIQRGSEHFLLGRSANDLHSGVKLDAYHFQHNFEQAHKQPIRFTLRQPTFLNEANQFRKQLMLSMGGIFLLFGIVLQRILQTVLTKPFAGMVGVAQQFSKNPSSRFFEQGNNEFSYLGKFINQVLDELVEQHQALLNAKERVEVTLNSIGDAVITTNPEAKITYMNPAAERLTGWKLAAVKLQPLEQVMRTVDSKTGVPLNCSACECIEQGETIVRTLDQRLLTHDNEAIEIEGTTAPMRDASGNILGAVVVFQDVGDVRKMTHQLSYQASHDMLTNLFNRREFESRIETALEQYRTNAQDSAILYIDLDQFKIVNDTCGHIAGDELLCQISQLIKKQMRSVDIVARLGGDEFGVLIHRCNKPDAQAIAQKLCKSISGFRFTWDAKVFDIGASIGLVSLSDKLDNLVDILRAADIACFSAKDQGRNRIHIYSDDHPPKLHQEQLLIIPSITKALEEDRFCLYQQEIFPLTAHTGEQRYFEILIRGINVDGDIIAPNTFISAAERYHLMPRIDRWVFERLLAHYHHFVKRQNGDEIDLSRTAPFRFSLNLSGKTLSDDSFLDVVEDLLQRYPLPPGALCFEITETAAIANLAKAGECIRVLKNRGCQFALDDFGSGVSSFFI